MVFEEGRDTFPHNGSHADHIRWREQTPKSHHILWLNDGATYRERIENRSRSKATYFVQRFGEGWMLACGQTGAHIYQFDGAPLRDFDIGQAVSDVQTTEDGLTWVSYFDEGVFSNGIAQNGLVCFNSTGEPVFRFAKFARQYGLPPIDDCYALNVIGRDVWLSYYSAFPLVCLRDFQLHSRHDGLGPTSAFAIRGNEIMKVSAYRPAFVTANLGDMAPQEITLLDENGAPLGGGDNGAHAETSRPRRPYRSVGRGRELFLYTDKALYKVP